MRASLGPTLETVKHNCKVAYSSHHDPNPAHFDDSTWLDSFYSIDGDLIVALGHMEYHGWEHPGQCSSKDYDPACWYNADTFHLSKNGGYHFGSFPAPGNYVLGVPYKYEVNRGPEGYSIDTNIVKTGDWYYAMVTGWPWPPNCIEGDKSNPCLVHSGGSPIRTSNILDPASWRGWNGQEFAVTFVDPYEMVIKPNHVAVSFTTKDHVFTPVPYMDCVNAINFHETSGLFIATLCDPYNTEYGPEGIYLSTSPDLIHWSEPTLVVSIDQLRAKEPKGNWSYAYASLIDPRSTDLNCSTVTDEPYLYYVRMDDSNPPYTRVLFRQKISLHWSVQH